LSDPNRIPDTPFHIHSIRLRDNQRLADADFSVLRGLTGLRTIDAPNSNVGDSLLEHVDDCTNLVHLGFQNVPYVTDAGLQHVKGLTKLQTLQFDEARVSDAGRECLRNLTELRFLHLDCTEVSDAGIQHLAGLPKLDTLYISCSQVGGKGQNGNLVCETRPTNGQGKMSSRWLPVVKRSIRKASRNRPAVR